jgi:hypothetical protein
MIDQSDPAAWIAFEEEIGAVAVARIDHGAVHQRLIHPHRHGHRSQPLPQEQAASEQQAGSGDAGYNEGRKSWHAAQVHGLTTGTAQPTLQLSHQSPSTAR